MLFDLGPRRLTPRDVARVVQTAGADGLTEAERRADAARYQEIVCRSALNRVRGMPFEWTLNPYRGCTHACHYCFARRYQTQLELGSGDEFSSLIFVTTNFVEVLRRELDHPKWTRQLAALGTATDPYQPIEGHYGLTRAVKAIADHGARFVGTNILFLDGGTREHFMRFLSAEFPALSDQYGQLYASKYVPKDYAERVKKTVGVLKARYGLSARKRRGEDSTPALPPAPAQTTLW